MQLHVLGPAFGLPSIDAECIAAIALLRSCLRDEAWTIVPSHGHEQIPRVVDSSADLTGYRNILEHLETAGRLEQLSSIQCADSTAISSFIESNAQTLLDLSLYVAFENYRLTTRPAFTAILPWHANYMIPPRRRAAARARTDHLGVSSIDIDNVHEDMSNKPGGRDVGKEQGFEAETQKRASLLLPRKETVRSLLQRPEHAATFKLNALADNFFGPLQDMLVDQTYLLGTDGPQPVDCLAYGYLSLMLYPKVPQDWLASTMRKKYKTLVRYVERLNGEFKMHTNVEDVKALSKCRMDADIEGRRKAQSMTLPWGPPQPSNPFSIVSSVTQDLLSRLTLLRPSTTIISTQRTKSTFLQRYFPAVLGFAATSFAFLGYYAFRTELLTWPKGEEVHIFGRKRFTDYGAAGAALSALGGLSQQMSFQDAYQQQHRNEGLVEVDVFVEDQARP